LRGSVPIICPGVAGGGACPVVALAAADGAEALPAASRATTV
jgi:hypothetical protein